MMCLAFPLSSSRDPHETRTGYADVSAERAHHGITLHVI